METAILEYLEAKKQLTHFKKLEHKLRIGLIDMAFPQSNIGTTNVQHNQYCLKGKFGLNYKLDKSIELYDLSPQELSCVSLKPTLVMSEYNNLAPSERKSLDAFVTVSPALPTLTVEVE